jgi:hypothetical protein
MNFPFLHLWIPQAALLAWRAWSGRGLRWRMIPKARLEWQLTVFQTGTNRGDLLGGYRFLLRL